MYGKIFESLFTGSLVGAGSHVFSVMAYVIASQKPDRKLKLVMAKQIPAYLKESVHRIHSQIKTR